MQKLSVLMHDATGLLTINHHGLEYSSHEETATRLLHCAMGMEKNFHP